MAYQDTGSFIRQRKRKTRSLDEQVQISHAAWDNKIGPNHDGLKRKEIKSALNLNLSYKPKTSLHHLEEIGIFEEFVTGPDKLAIAEWMDNGDGEIVLGRVGEAAEEGLTALADQIGNSGGSSGKPKTAADGSGPTLRNVVATELQLIPKEVENYLRSTTEPVNVLNQAVQAIKEEDTLSVSDGYGEIIFINSAYRYRLTEMAVELYRR